MRKAVAMVAGPAVLEASGNITLETVAPIAETGVDYLPRARSRIPRPTSISRSTSRCSYIFAAASVV